MKTILNRSSTPEHYNENLRHNGGEDLRATIVVNYVMLVLGAVVIF